MIGDLCAVSIEIATKLMFHDDPRLVLRIRNKFQRAEYWGLGNTAVNYESYRAMKSNLESLISISQLGLILLKHQTRNNEAIFKDVKENFMVDGVKSSAQDQMNKNTNLASAIDVSCNVIVHGDDRSLSRVMCAIGGLADR